MRTSRPATKPRLSVTLASPLLEHLRLRRRALQMLIEIRQARHFLDVLVVDAIEPLGALPVAFPMLRVGHGVLDLELRADHLEALHDVQLLTRRDRDAALIHPVM